MGGGQSSLIRDGSDASNHGNCLPCLPFKPNFPQANNDPIGSPLPDTPVHAKRKQHAVQDALREENLLKTQVFSSKYGGLEKEVEDLDQENGNVAVIHEGKVRISPTGERRISLHRKSYIHRVDCA